MSLEIRHVYIDLNFLSLSLLKHYRHKVIPGHTGWVHCLAVDPQNKFYASSGKDRLIKIWDMATNSLKLTLTGHSAAIRALELSHRSPYMFSAGEDNEIRCI